MQQSEFQIDTCVAWVLDCMNSPNPDGPLLTLSADPRPLAGVVSENNKPHPLVGILTAMMAGALIRAERPDEVEKVLECVADLFAPGHRYYVRGTNFGDLANAFPYLHLSTVRASLATADYATAFSVMLMIDDMLRRELHWVLQDDPTLAPILAHPAIDFYGPFSIERDWLLDRQDEILAGFKPDRNLIQTYDFEEFLIFNALLTEQPRRALPVIESRGLLGPLDVATVGSCGRGHLEFNAVCVLAALGRFDEALSLARAMVQYGYGTIWRFDLENASNMAWTQDTRQNEWLAALAQTPAYHAFLDDYVRQRHFQEDDAAFNPLCAMRQDIWDSKKKKRCWLSKRLISSGEPVVRTRRLFTRASDGDFDIAAKEAFDTSTWSMAGKQFAGDAIPLSSLFPHPSLSRLHDWDDPKLARFCWDVGRNPASFNLDQAIGIIADHQPNSIRREWIQGKFVYAPAFKPVLNDRGHGEAINFVWRLLKAGYAQDLFERMSRLPPDKADKVFAMLVMFDREDCRQAAAVHFALPDLPETIEQAFSERPSLETHLALADYGDRHQRWRSGLVAAMRAYALHLYSNYHPGADWFLEGLEHFSRARCCQLLFFLIHHPEDDPVLATMIEMEWLPTGVGVGAFDAYGNTRAFYYRTVVLNRMLHAPGQLEFWLNSPWLLYYCSGAKDRETRRLVERWQKKNR